MLRGNLPINFFDEITRYIYNWGAQYFIASFFNQKLGGHIVMELIERLEDLYGVCFNRSLDRFQFYISGNDSALSYRLCDRFSEVFPFPELNAQVNVLVGNSDLCLIVDNEFSGSSVAIFGEVEGVHGHRFGWGSYWSKKNKLCVFGIGFVEGQNKQVYFVESHHDGTPRVHLLFEKSHFLVTDFMAVIQCFHWYFLNGPVTAYPTRDDEFDFFSKMLIRHWNSPIHHLFSELEQYIDGGELVGFNDGPLCIITDLQAR